jgi:hypothetical protein
MLMPLQGEEFLVLIMAIWGFAVGWALGVEHHRAKEHHPADSQTTRLPE